MRPTSVLKMNLFPCAKGARAPLQSRSHALEGLDLEHLEIRWPPYIFKIVRPTFVNWGCMFIGTWICKVLKMGEHFISLKLSDQLWPVMSNVGVEWWCLVPLWTHCLGCMFWSPCICITLKSFDKVYLTKFLKVNGVPMSQCCFITLRGHVAPFH